jgi:Uma2 family endonuclease
VDLGVKRHAYARAGVPECWIVRPAQRDVLVCTQPNAALGDYAQTDHALPEGELVSPTLPFRTTVAGLFAGAPDTTL